MGSSMRWRCWRWRRSRQGLRAGGAGLWLTLAGWCFALALVLFPGSLYLLAAGAPAGIAWLTPIGGTLFILGWVLVALAALAGSRA